MSGSVGYEERRNEILTRLEKNGSVRLEEVTAYFNVSAMTVRRDLGTLESEGLLRRVRGGAVATVRPEGFGARQAANAAAKAEIARKALPLMPLAGAVAMDASSTVAALAAAVKERTSLLVATNSIPTFTALRQGEQIQPLMVGGSLEETTGSFVGPLACHAAGMMLYSHFFTSASAVHPEFGTSEASLMDSQVKHIFARSAAEVMLCVDSSKMGARSIAVGFPWSSVDLLITELDPDDERLDPFRDRVSLL